MAQRRADDPQCISDQTAVLRAAQRRAAALAAGDEAALFELLHADFRWTSHRGETFDRDEYVGRNTGGETVWRSQVLHDVQVILADDTAVLVAAVTDVVLVEGVPTTFRMPVTQVWVRDDGDWTCLAGHAGPLEEGPLGPET